MPLMTGVLKWAQPLTQIAALVAFLMLLFSGLLHTNMAAQRVMTSGSVCSTGALERPVFQLDLMNCW